MMKDEFMKWWRESPQDHNTQYSYQALRAMCAHAFESGAEAQRRRDCEICETHINSSFWGCQWGIDAMVAIKKAIERHEERGEV